MKRLIVLCSVAVALVAGAAIAAKTQVVNSAWMMLTKGAYYGRSDGIAQSTHGKGIHVIENGTVGGSLGKGFYEDFTAYGDDDGLYCEDTLPSNSMVCAGNAALVSCTCRTGSGHSFAWMPLLQEDIGPDMDADGLDIGGDQTNNDGAMLIWGGLYGSSGKPFVVGYDPAFYMCTTVDATDIAGIDGNIMAGFVVLRGYAALTDTWNADFEALDAYAGIGILGTSGSGLTAEDVTIKTETDAALDGTGDGVTTTDTTDDVSEGVQNKFCTYVSGAGAVTYTINGAAPTTTAAFSFVDGVIVVPFLTYLHTAEISDEIVVSKVEVGYSD